MMQSGQSLHDNDWLERSARNLAAQWEHPVRAMGQRWERWDDAWAVDPLCPNPIPNSATLLRPLDASGASDLVDRLSQFYDVEQAAPWVLWSAWPAPDLQQYGCQLIGRPPLMVRLPGGDLPLSPPELRIVEVDNAVALADFERGFILGYPVPELQPIRAGAFYDTRILGGRLRLWVGYVGEQPVTTALAYVGDDVIGVYLVATVPEARGHGYGSAVTLRAAAADPTLPAVLQASDKGYKVYERLGFSEVARYDLWLKPRQSQP